MERFIRRLCKDTRGATIIEYGLLVTFIAAAMVLGLTQVNDRATSMYLFIASQVTSS